MVEADRHLFVDLFRDDDFMVYSGALDLDAAHARFDRMVATGTEVPFAKQPVIVRATGQTVGYCGVAWFDFEGERRLEFGWRLVPSARGKGYATEAAAALLATDAARGAGEILAMIDPTNLASQHVAAKLGFEYWKMAEVHGWLDQIHRWRVRPPTTEI